MDVLRFRRLILRFIRVVAFVFGALCCALITAARANVSAGPVIDLEDESTIYNVLARADVLDDPDGALDIDDVARSGAFVRSSAAARDDGHARWYRFRTTTPIRSQGRWYLVPLKCEDADLYVPRSKNLFTVHRFGWSRPDAARVGPNFVGVPLPAKDLQTLFVRLSCIPDLRYLSIWSAERIAQQPSFSRQRVVAILLSILAVLTLGLALITRTRSYAYLSASAIFGAIYFNLNGLRIVFPIVFSALSPWYTGALGGIAVYLPQTLFYQRFLDLRKDRACAALIWIAFSVAAVNNLIRRDFRASLTVELLNNVPGIAFWIIVAVVAVIVARRGNRSAWFVAAGATYYAVSYVLYIFDDFPQFALHGLDLPFYYSVPVDIVLFVFGVGDRLRQTSLAYRKSLAEKDAARIELSRVRQEHIAALDRRNLAFARFVPNDFLRQIGRTDILDVRLGDHAERTMAVLVSDIRKFTSLSERMTPNETFAFLNAYLGRVAPLIRKHGGFVDEYIGDAIVALFAEGPSQALDAAIALQSEVRLFNEDRARKGGRPIAIGVGLHYGPMILGTIGETERLETRVIADAVNLASKLEAMTKEFGVSIIASDSLVAMLERRDAYCLRPLGSVLVPGRERAETVFEIFDGDAHELALHKRVTLARFETALAAFEAGRFDASFELFAQIAKSRPDDRAASYLRDRSDLALQTEAR